MARFSEVLAQQDDVVTSPDGNIKARIEGGKVTDLQFRPGTYERYSDAALGSQLESFSKLVAVQRRRTRRKALRDALGYDRDPEPARPMSSKDREMIERQKEIDVKVKTSNIKVHLPDAHNWNITIKPGTTKTVSEESFRREIADVTKQVTAELRLKLHAVRQEVYGPSSIYKAMADPQ